MKVMRESIDNLTVALRDLQTGADRLAGIKQTHTHNIIVGVMVSLVDHTALAQIVAGKKRDIRWQQHLTT
eukprot:4023480-Ditylum_brightwellii.AAC.1